MSFIAKYFIAQDVKRHFRFLFYKGYEIRRIIYSPESFGNWQAFLESKGCSIIITNDRSEIFLSFAAVSTDKRDEIGLQSMIYFLSNSQKFIYSNDEYHFWEKRKQFEKLAKLLDEYIDQIEPFFIKDYEKYKFDMLAAQTKYNERLLKSSR